MRERLFFHRGCLQFSGLMFRWKGSAAAGEKSLQDTIEALIKCWR